MAALCALAACGPQGSGGGSPASLAGTPIDLTDPLAAKSSFLVWAALTVEPPPAVATTDLGVVLAKGTGGGGVALKPLDGTECPVADFLNFDPAGAGALPDPLFINLDYLRADLVGRCVSGTDEKTGRVELTVRGAVVMAGTELVPEPGGTLEAAEAYPSWTDKVTQPSGNVIAYSFGGSRTTEVDGSGAVRVTSPLITRRAVERTDKGVKVDERFYQVSNLTVTRTPVDGLGGPGTATREDGAMRLASSLDGYTDVLLSGVVRDPAVCDGAPSGGFMQFQNGGLAMFVYFDYGGQYVSDGGFYCGKAHVLRPQAEGPAADVFDATPPVL